MKLFLVFILSMCIVAFISVVLDKSGVKHDMLVMAYIGVPLCMAACYAYAAAARWLAFRLPRGESPTKKGKKGKRKRAADEEAPEETEGAVDDSIHLQCGCGKRLKFAAALAGKKGKCPGCGRGLAI